MRLLAIGISVIKNLKAFTLIEVMMVMFIMAIVTVVAMLSLHLMNHARQVTLTAEHLAQTIKIAENEALLRATVLGLAFNQRGYQFYELTRDHQRHPMWKKILNDKLSQPDAFQNDIQVKWVNPKNNIYIVFSSSGDVSPFTVRITDHQRDRAYLLMAQQNGVIQLQQINPP